MVLLSNSKSTYSCSETEVFWVLPNLIAEPKHYTYILRNN